MKHLTNLSEISLSDVQAILEQTKTLKAEWQAGRRPPLLAGKVLTQVFEKPSLRTRVSFESAIQQMGGSSIFLSAKDAGFGGRESTADIARVLTSYCDVIVLRTFSQQLIDDFALHGSCSVVNGLSDDSHPCQALTDLFTMQEVFGSLQGLRLAYIGDGNNVAVSLAEICAMLGVSFIVAAPEGYLLPETFLDSLREKFPSANLSQTTDLHAAVKDADVLYTDVWASMGQESEKESRAKTFSDYQINAKLMALAPEHAKFMHCLPARRGLEVTDDVIDGKQSIVFQQAENRMHLAKGLFAWLLTS